MSTVSWFFLAVILVGLVVFAFMLEKARGSKALPGHSEPTEAEAEAIQAHIGEADFRVAHMVSQYGFISTSTTMRDGKLFDIQRFRELPTQKRFICIDPDAIGDDGAFKKELKRVRNVVNQRVRNQAKATTPAEIDNLRVPDDLELVQEMADAISRPEPKMGGRRTH